jgi:hypothetical protein
MEWATFKINNESENPELIFIEIFRLASIQAGCAATRLQSDVSLGEKPGQATPEGAALTSVDLAAPLLWPIPSKQQLEFWVF